MSAGAPMRACALAAQRVRRVLGPAALCAALAVGGGPALAADAADAVRQGASLLAPFKASLMRALGTGLAGGPLAAIETCRVEAPAIAANAAAPGVEIGRASDRLRNPANTAPPWVAPLLHDYLDGAARKPRVVELAEGRAGYVEPILMQPMCLACHGPALDADVLAALAEHYPNDEATGYAVGELRGVFWATFEPAPVERAPTR